MTTEHDMAVAIATEIGKQVPVKQAYDDAASPAMKQVGATFEDVVKCIRLVGLPIQWLAIQQDRFRAFIEASKNKVPEERRILPAPQLLGPVLEAIRYEVAETPLTEMFQTLLARGMDKQRAGEAHPSFIQILKSISPDEAAILEYAKNDLISVRNPNPGIVNIGIYDSNTYLLSEVDLEFADRSKFYIEHLYTLGLLAWEHDKQFVGYHEGKPRAHSFIGLSVMGIAFMKACSPSA